LVKKLLLVLPLVLISPFALSSDNKDAECLAENIYHEARGESTLGKIAVGLVTINRVRDARWPSNICSVVYEGPVRESWKTKQNTSLSPESRIFYPVKDKCQFSWYCDGKADTINYSSYDWQSSYQIAQMLLENNKYEGLLEGATHYHATYVTPDWRLKLTLITRIDNHLFYR